MEVLVQAAVALIQRSVFSTAGERWGWVGELPGWAHERLQAASDADIDRWLERILVAGTLDDVFAD